MRTLTLAIGISVLAASTAVAQNYNSPYMTFNPIPQPAPYVEAPYAQSLPSTPVPSSPFSSMPPAQPPVFPYYPPTPSFNYPYNR